MQNFNILIEDLDSGTFKYFREPWVFF